MWTLRLFPLPRFLLLLQPPMSSARPYVTLILIYVLNDTPHMCNLPLVAHRPSCQDYFLWLVAHVLWSSSKGAPLQSSNICVTRLSYLSRCTYISALFADRNIGKLFLMPFAATPILFPYNLQNKAYEENKNPQPNTSLSK